MQDGPSSRKREAYMNGSFSFALHSSNGMPNRMGAGARGLFFGA